MSKCEFRTFLNQKEVWAGEYYLWNYQPNANENASQFLQKLVWTLIYKNECLVVETGTGDLLIADSYTHNRYAVYEDTFSNVTVCADGGTPFTFRKTFRASDVLFFRLSNKNIASLLEQLNQEYTELIQAAVQKFYKGGGERGILNIDGNAVSKNYGTKEDGTPRTFNDVYNEMVNKQFANYFKSPNAVMTLWSGFEYNSRSSDASKKSTSDVKDITDLTDEIYEKVACALQIPPALLKGDIADVRELTKNFLTFSVDPLAKMMEREINRKRNGTEVLRGNYIAIDTSTVQHIEPFDVAEAVDKLRAASVLNVDEIRKRIGEPEIGQPWSREYVMTKNYSGVDPPEEGGTE